MDELFTYVRRGVESRKGKWPELASKADVSYSWLTKFGAGKYDETNVGHRTLRKLADYFQRETP